MLSSLSCIAIVSIFSTHIFASPVLPPPSDGLRIRITPRQSTVDTEDAASRVCNPSLIDYQLTAVVSKYAPAEQYLMGMGLVPLNLENFASPGIDIVEVPFSTSKRRASSDLIPTTSITGESYPVTQLTDLISGNLDILYYGPVALGTPSQTLTVDVDTGSSDLWLPANCPGCDNSQFFPERSSTYSTKGDKFAITYGSGSARGIIASDTVTIGGLTIDNQTFGAVNRVSSDFNSFPNDGLLGMAFGSIARTRKETVFENLMIQRKVKNSFFSVHLTRKREQGSELCLGCFDDTKARGRVTWIPVQSKTYWTVHLDSFFVDSKRLSIATQQIYAAIDTGTSLIYFPGNLADAFYGLIPGARLAKEFGAGLYAYPCNNSLSVALSFSGFDFSIDIRDFNLGKISKDSNECIGGIVSSGDSGPKNLAIIGVLLLKSWYTTYDYSNGARVGFSPSINN